MSDDKPVVRWHPGRRVLVAPDGREVTNAQQAKARRYVEKELVKQAGKVSPDAPWGAPWREEVHYNVLPLPGCKDTNQVVVIIHHAAGDDSIAAIDYRCSCQRANGTTSTTATVCSHSLAVHHLRNPKEE